MRDALFQMNAPAFEPPARSKSLQGLDGKIRVIRGNAGDIAGEGDARSLASQRKADGIGDINLHEPSLDFMEAVVTLSKHAKPEVDLGVGGKFESAGGHGDGRRF